MNKSAKRKPQLRKVAPFLPRHVARTNPAAGRMSRRTGALLFADISGFTSLTEKMGRAGREGAEELTVRVNDFFEKLLSVIRRYGADVLKFGGDALLIGFDDNSSPQMAVKCAGDLVKVAESAGRLKTRAGRFRLRLHVGLSLSPYYEIICGDPGRRREHFLFGEAVHRCQKAADAAHSGEVVAALPSELLPSFAFCRPTRRARGFYLLSPAESIPDSQSAYKHSAGEPAEWWQGLLDPAVHSLVMEKKSEWIGEHRSVSVVFVFFNGSDRWPPQTAEAAFRSVLDTVCAALEKWGGTWSRSDPGSAYQKLLFLFGAPTTGENDPERAVGFALDLKNRFQALRESGIQLNFGIGVASGRLFSGFVGGKARREYTVMGDAINLAARLAARSFGSRVTTDQITVQGASGRYLFKPLRPVKLKGKAAPVRLFRPLKPAPSTGGRAECNAGEYYPRIVEEIKGFISGRPAKKGYGVIITGEAGCGKSTLARRLIEQTAAPDTGPIHVTLWPEEKSIAFSGLSRILVAVFRGAADDPRDLRRRFLASWPPLVAPQWQPLFADLLGITFRSTALVRGLNQQARLQKLAELFPEVVAGAIGRTAQPIMIDNYQWMDPSSKSVFDSWWADVAQYPVSLVTTCRDDEEVAAIQRGSRDVFLSHLGSVEKAGIVRLVKARFPGVEPPARLVTELIRRSRSVPAVADAYLDHWIDQVFVFVDPRNSRRLQIEDLAADDLPDALMAAYVRRLDALTQTQSEVLRAAAIWGGAATLSQLKHLVSPGLSKGELASAIRDLQQVEHLVNSGGDRHPAFSVAHPLMAQAAYQTMSFAERRRGHALAARLWEKRRGRGKAAILARHYLAAGDERTALPALLAAAAEAAPVGAYLEARSFLRQAERLLPRRTDTQSKVNVCTELALMEQALGNYDVARRFYGRAEKVAGRLGRTEKSLLLKLALGRLYWIAGEYERCRKTVDRIMHAPAAMDNHRVIGQARHLSGELSRRHGQFEKAEATLKQALENFHAIKDKAGLLDARNTLGIVCWNQGKLAEAAAHFRAALKLGPAVVDYASRARLSNNLGILYEEQANLKRARQYYQRAFEIFTTIGHRRNRAYCLGNLANIDRLSGRFDDAREAYDEVLRETLAIGEAHAHAYTLGNLGDLYADFGDFDRAAPYFRRTLTFARRADDDELKAETKLRMAALARGRRRPFIEHIAEAARLARQAGSVEFLIKADLFAAARRRASGDSAGAIEDLLSLLERAKQARLILYEVLGHEELAQAYRDLGDDRRGRRYAAAGLKQARQAGFRLVEIRLNILAARTGFRPLPNNERIRRIDDATRRYISAANDIVQSVLAGIADERLKKIFLEQEDLRFLKSFKQTTTSRTPAT